MTTRAAARPPRRHPKARARAATLPASYTTTGDTTATGAPGGNDDCRTARPRLAAADGHHDG